MQEKFEDAKGLIRSLISDDRQYKTKQDKTRQYKTIQDKFKNRPTMADKILNRKQRSINTNPIK